MLARKSRQMDPKERPPAGSDQSAGDFSPNPDLTLVGDDPEADSPGPAAGQAEALTPAQNQARLSVDHRRDELDQARAALARAEAAGERLAELAGNLNKVDSLTLDNFQPEHKRLALEAEATASQRKTLLVDCQRAEAQLARAEQAWAKLQSDQPVDLAA